MQALLEGVPTRLSLDLEAPEARAAFLASAQAQQVVMVRLPEAPTPFLALPCDLGLPGGRSLQIQVMPVQTFPDGEDVQVVFQLMDWDGAKAGVLEAGGPEPPSSDETFGASPVFRIKQLDPPQRQLLALKADRVERQILCRDTSPMVLLALMNNPRLEGDNVLALVKSTFATAEIFQRVAADKRWMASAEIRTAVVRNPKTPTPIATRLLETLSLNELREMARMGSLREDLRKAALRVLLKRTGDRG